MSLRLEMLQVARLAPRLLGESTDLVRDFVLSQLHDDGGFVDREGKPDLYYTVFGIDCLIALQAEVPRERVEPYILSFGLEELDLVHLSCLARAHAALPQIPLTSERRDEFLERLESFRSADGAFHNGAGRETGTVYGYFLATGIYQDLGLGDLAAAQREALMSFLQAMETPDGGYTNEPLITVGATPATAAAVTLLRYFDGPTRFAAAEFLESLFDRENGGFRALPGAPIPDLLSTATALHALVGLQRSLEEFQEPCLGFIDTLWLNRGSFFAHWADDILDCEYTFYGLLALGHLSV